MSLTKLQPNSVNTTATFTFANINVTDTANLGDVTNLIITGGSSGQYLQTDGAGNLAWAAGGGGGGGGSPGGIDTYVQFNDGGNFGGTSAFTFNKSTNSVVVSGNITGGNIAGGNLVSANYISGNGSLLTGITASTAGTVTSNAQPNITSVGSLSGLTVSNATGVVNFTTTANVTLGSVSNLHISGGTSGYVLSTDGSGTLSWVAQSGGSSYGNSNVAAYLPTYTGNVSANYFIGNGSTLTYITGGNVSGNVTSAIQSHYANIANSITGGNVSGQVGNALVAGTVYTNAQPNITSVGTLASLTVTANISSGNANLGNLVTATYFIGNGIYLSNVAGANVSGVVANATYSTSAGSATTAGTVTTNAQPNITSVGTLAGLTGTGVFNLTGTSNVALGAVGNVHISGGTSGYVLSTDGSGTLSWVAQSGGGGGSNYGNSNVADYLPTYTGNISANYFIGNGATLTYITGSNVNGNVTSAIQAHYANIANSVTGSNVSGQVGNALVAGTVYTNAQPNITSVGSLSSLTVTANISSGNANLGNLVTASYFSGNGSLLTGLPAGYANSNVAAYLPTYTGNISANYFIGNGSTLTNITGANVTGNVTSAIQSHYANIANSVTGGNVSGQVGNALVAGTVYTNAQPNITSVGTLTSLSVSGDATVAGNFTVTGTTTFINVDSFKVQDPIIELGGGVNGAPLTTNDGKDRGTLLHYYTTGAIDAFMGWDNSNGEFAFGSNVSVSSEVVTFNNFGNVRANNFFGTATTATSATTAGTVTTNAQPNITSIGTLAGLTGTGVFDLTGTSNVALGAVGNIHISGGTSGYVLSTDGSGGLSWVAQSGGGGSSYGNSNVAAYLPTYTGNVSANYFIGNGATLTYITGGNVSGNVTSAIQSHYANIANSVAGSNVSGQVGNALVAGTVYTNAQPNITSVGSLSSLTVTGLITATGTGLKAANIEDSSGTITIVTGYGSVSGAVGIYGNITAGTSGTGFFVGNGSYLSGLTGSNVSGQVGNALVAGTVYTNAQPNITSVGTLTTLTSGTHTISANANIAMSGTLSQISGANLISGTYLTGTLTTAAQPNITSVGSLSGLTVSNATGVVDFTTTANVTLGNVSNLHISGGTSGYVLGTDGSGGLSWVAQSGGGGGSPGGLDTYVQFNDGGSTFGGNSQFTYNKTTNLLTVGNVAGTLTTTAQPNISSVGTLSSLSVSGNLTVSGWTILQESTDTLSTKTGATGSVTHDLSTGLVFYHTSISASFTAAFTNVPTDNDRTIVVVLFLVQGATAYIASGVTINGGSAETIKWVNGITPVGNINKVDVISFTLIRTGSAWTVLGQLGTYG